MKTDSKRKMILGVQLVGCCFAICIIYGGFIAVKRLMKENMVSTKTAKEQAEVAAIVHIEPTPVEAPVVEESFETPVRNVVYDNMTIEELAAKLDRSLNSTLTGKGYLFASKSLEYGVDPYLALAIVLEETGCKWNCSNLVKQCNNVGGQKGGTVKCNGGAYRYFATLDEGIIGFIDNLSRNYYAIGLTTPEQMNSKYAASKTWSSKVNQYIEKIKSN